MTSPATLSSSSPLSSTVDIAKEHEVQLEESLLKRKLAILEEFMRNDMPLLIFSMINEEMEID